MNRYITIAGVVLLGTVVASEKRMAPLKNSEALVERLQQLESEIVEIREDLRRNRSRSNYRSRDHSHDFDAIEV